MEPSESLLPQLFLTPVLLAKVAAWCVKLQNTAAILSGPEVFRPSATSKSRFDRGSHTEPVTFLIANRITVTSPKVIYSPKHFMKF